MFITDFSNDLAQARKFYTQNNLSQSFDVCRNILQFDPENYEALLLVALTSIKADNFTAAEEVILSLVSRQPKDPRPAIALAYAYESQARVAEANQQFAKVIKIDVTNEDAHFHLALTYERMNKLDQAEKAVSKGFRAVGQTPGLLYMAAIIARRRKKFEDAITYLEKIEDTAQVEYVANKHFELMQNYDRTKEYDRAFASLEIAQQKRIEFLRRQGYSESKENYQFIVQKYLDFLEKQPSAERAPFQPQHPKNICFFMGFPRSGTTLAQNMLQASPVVETLEEKGALLTLSQEYLQTHGNSFEGLSYLSDAKIQEMRHRYEALVAPHLEGKEYQLLIDKMPLGTVHVPLIQTIFPEAKILVALRHPCDCILSGMMQNFDPNSAMLNLTNLTDGAHLYAQAFTILERSEKKYHITPYFFKYEDMIANPEQELRGICNYLELEWSEDMLNYQAIVKKQDLVHTASFRQVSEPIYQQAKYRWLHYKKYFDDVLGVLRPYLQKFDYREE